jgi:hypothetical protein
MQINPIAGPSQADYTQVMENIRRIYNGRARTLYEWINSCVGSLDLHRIESARLTAHK